MIAIKAHFNGNEIEIPEELRGTSPREVLLVFERGVDEADSSQRDFWLKVQESSFATAWENDEDAVYDAI